VSVDARGTERGEVDTSSKRPMLSARGGANGRPDGALLASEEPVPAGPGAPLALAGAMAPASGALLANGGAGVVVTGAGSTGIARSSSSNGAGGAGWAAWPPTGVFCTAMSPSGAPPFGVVFAPADDRPSSPARGVVFASAAGVPNSPASLRGFDSRREDRGGGSGRRDVVVDPAVDAVVVGPPVDAVPVDAGEAVPAVGCAALPDAGVVAGFIAPLLEVGLVAAGFADAGVAAIGFKPPLPDPVIGLIPLLAGAAPVPGTVVAAGFAAPVPDTGVVAAGFMPPVPDPGGFAPAGVGVAFAPAPVGVAAAGAGFAPTVLAGVAVGRAIVFVVGVAARATMFAVPTGGVRVTVRGPVGADAVAAGLSSGGTSAVWRTSSARCLSGAIGVCWSRSHSRSSIASSSTTDGASPGFFVIA
jgi:hypothetical protein